MSKRDLYESKTEELVTPLIEQNNFELVDVEYVKEGSNYFLRIVIDRDEPIDIDTCVEVTNIINPLLDKADFIKDSYILDISSKEKGDNNG